MTLRQWFTLLLFALGWHTPNAASAQPFVNFEPVAFDHAPGKYTKELLALDFGKPEYAVLQRFSVVEDRSGNRVLRATTAKGAWDDERSGGSFKADIPPRDEHTFEYRVRFGGEDGAFDFNKGGKLPGLGGGRANTGGNKPTGDGWSARYMWRRDGALVVYLYHPDQPGEYGEDLPLGVRATLNRWHTLRQTIRLNTDGKANGLLRVWVDGDLRLDRADIRYRRDALAPVDHLLFEHFWGGGDASWAAREPSIIDFDDARLIP